jgi:hypothetical protein
MFLPLLLLLQQCDFPSDPPIKSGDDPVITPPANPSGPAELLPLNEGNAWAYLVKPRVRPESSPIWVTPRKLEYRGETYFHLLYGIGGMGPSGFIQAFPSLLRSDSTGLHFYLPMGPNDTLSISHEPKHLFTLPYPALPGTITSSGTSQYSVTLTHIDTLMTIHASSIMLPCHRYEVSQNQRLTTVFYIVPGICFLRIEDDEALFLTIGWRLKR